MPPACRCPLARSWAGCRRSVCRAAPPRRTHETRRSQRLAMQRDARAPWRAAEIEPHLAVAVAPPFNERQACSSLAHLCHPNCGRWCRRCRRQSRRQWAGDQSPHRVAARPTQGGAPSAAVGSASIRQPPSCRRCWARRRHKPPQRPGRSAGGERRRQCRLSCDGCRPALARFTGSTGSASSPSSPMTISVDVSRAVRSSGSMITMIVSNRDGLGFARVRSCLRRHRCRDRA